MEDLFGEGGFFVLYYLIFVVVVDYELSFFIVVLDKCMGDEIW